MPTLSLEEAHAILDLKVGANEEEIKASYKKLALKTHPDKNKNDPDAHHKFLKVSEAYKRITDPSSFQDDEGEGSSYFDSMDQDALHEMFTGLFASTFFDLFSGEGAWEEYLEESERSEMPLSAIVGETLQTHEGLLDTNEIVNNCQFVGLYFSASWCLPCKKFTNLLSTFYETLKESDEDRYSNSSDSKTNKKSKKTGSNSNQPGIESSFEVIFVSQDENEQQFDKYFQSMPFRAAIPFHRKAIIEDLMQLFDVQGVPTLVVLDPRTCGMVDLDGVSTLNHFLSTSHSEKTQKKIQSKKRSTSSNASHPDAVLDHWKQVEPVLMTLPYYEYSEEEGEEDEDQDSNNDQSQGENESPQRNVFWRPFHAQFFASRKARKGNNM